MQHQQQDNRMLDLTSRQSSMYWLVGVFAYVKLFTQRLQSRIKRRSSNNHSQPLLANWSFKYVSKTKTKSSFRQRAARECSTKVIWQRPRSSASTTHDETPRPIFKQFHRKTVRNQPAGKPMRRVVFLQKELGRTSSAEYLLSKRFPTTIAPSSEQP